MNTNDSNHSHCHLSIHDFFPYIMINIASA